MTPRALDLVVLDHFVTHLSVASLGLAHHSSRTGFAADAVPSGHPLSCSGSSDERRSGPHGSGVSGGPWVPPLNRRARRGPPLAPHRYSGSPTARDLLSEQWPCARRSRPHGRVRLRRDCPESPPGGQDDADGAERRQAEPNWGHGQGPHGVDEPLRDPPGVDVLAVEGRRGRSGCVQEDAVETPSVGRSWQEGVREE